LLINLLLDLLLKLLLNFLLNLSFNLVLFLNFNGLLNLLRCFGDWYVNVLFDFWRDRGSWTRDSLVV
jgi:hypothetical protein